MRVQKGYNPKYPKEIETWKLGENIPDWLLDVCKVESINEFGEIKLAIRKLTNGYSLINSGSNVSLVSTKSNDDFICFGDNHIFSLTEKQMSILYK